MEHFPAPSRTRDCLANNRVIKSLLGSGRRYSDKDNVALRNLRSVVDIRLLKCVTNHIIATSFEIIRIVLADPTLSDKADFHICSITLRNNRMLFHDREPKYDGEHDAVDAERDKCMTTDKIEQEFNRTPRDDKGDDKSDCQDTKLIT